MATRKEAQGIKAEKNVVTASSCQHCITEIDQTSFKRPHVDENMRKELMEKYKYSANYHD